MTVIRLENGDLWLHSRVAPTDDRVEAPLAIGPVGHIVAPSKFHQLLFGGSFVLGDAVFSHGICVETGGRQFVENAFQ
ncbi:MAG: hypothetical protein JRG80_07020 [Deltaproteobacteria bacterium]|nr:hypothetical protein [Deltaproteobacteria bacterium]